MMIDLKVFIRNFNYKIIYIILETIIFLFFFYFPGYLKIIFFSRKFNNIIII